MGNLFRKDYCFHNPSEINIKINIFPYFHSQRKYENDEKKQDILTVTPKSTVYIKAWRNSRQVYFEYVIGENYSGRLLVNRGQVENLERHYLDHPSNEHYTIIE